MAVSAIIFLVRQGQKGSIQMTDFKQFNIWYYDFNYNDKRVKTCTRLEDALAFARMLVRDREELHVRFLSLESVY